MGVERDQRLGPTRRLPNLVVAMSVLAASALVAAGCATSAEPADGSEGLNGVVLVFAASSLTEVMADLEDGFEAANSGVDVEINLAGSSSLREQILEGAPADVFVSANEPIMAELVEEGAVTGPARPLAINRLEIAVPIDNPAGVRSLTDFGDESLLLGLCSPAVPCGDFALQALARAGVIPSIDTEEPDVRSLLAKVGAGELDAGLVYQTDIAASADTVLGVPIDAEDNVEAVYPIATLRRAPNPSAAAAFVQYALSDNGRAIAERHGFLLP